MTATVKLFIKRPTAGQELVPKVLKWATEDVDNPDLRDRGYIYWRLLSTDPGAASDIVLADKPPISTKSEAMDRGLLDRLLLHTGTLASIYGKEPQTFIRGSRPKFLQDSPALDESAKQSFIASLNLPVHRPPPPLITPASVSAPYNPDASALTAPLPPSKGRNGLGGGQVLNEDDDDDERGAQTLLGGGGDEEEDDDNRRMASAGADGDELDPYASLARMSMDDGGHSSRREYVRGPQDDLLL